MNLFLLPFIESFLREEWLQRFSLLLIVAVGVSLAYKASHFNFGMSGQMALGAFLTVFLVNLMGREESFLVILVSAFFSFTILFLLGIILAFLSYKIKINEFLTTWMLSQAMIPLLEGFILSTSLRSYDSARLSSFNIPWEFSGYLFLVIALVIWVCWVIIFYKSKWGLGIKSWADDKKFIVSLGFKPLPFILWPMAIGVGLMGFSGFLLISGYKSQYTVGLTSGWDILGITASLMVFHSPLGIFISSFLLSYLMTLEDLLSISWGYSIRWSIWIELSLLLLFSFWQSNLKRKE